MIGGVRKVPFTSKSVIGQRKVTFATVGKVQAWDHGTPVAGPTSCASRP